MNPVFGIHVGNTRACLAICKQDDAKYSVEVVADNAGDRVTPAMVTVTEVENVVGAACKSLLASRWATTITCNKIMQDEEWAQECQAANKKESHNFSMEKIVYHDGQLCYELPLDDRTEYRTAEDIATCIYRNLFDIAKSAAGELRDISCVLMVPERFSEEARFKTLSAAESASWNVMQVISEPAAAVLGAGLLGDKETPPHQTVLVYRVGGRTCDVTVLELDHGMITVLDSDVSEQANGQLIVRLLTDFLAEEFYRKYKLDPRSSRRALTKLTLAAENCLHVLSTVESASCFVESLCDGVDLNHNVSRARFDSLLLSHLSSFSKPIFALLGRLNMTLDGVSTLLLCGGPMKIPRLRKYVGDIFGECGSRVVLPPDGVGFDELLACGAARQAGFLQVAKIGDMCLPARISVPVLKFPLVVRVDGGEADYLELPSGLPLPFRKALSVRRHTTCYPLLLTFSQPASDSLLEGWVQLGEDVFGNQDNMKELELTLEVDSDSGIKVNFPFGPDEVKHFPVKMIASGDNFEDWLDTPLM